LVQSSLRECVDGLQPDPSTASGQGNDANSAASGERSCGTFGVVRSHAPEPEVARKWADETLASVAVDFAKYCMDKPAREACRHLGMVDLPVEVVLETGVNLVFSDEHTTLRGWTKDPWSHAHGGRLFCDAGNWVYAKVFHHVMPPPDPNGPNRHKEWWHHNGDAWKGDVVEAALHQWRTEEREGRCAMAKEKTAFIHTLVVKYLRGRSLERRPAARAARSEVQKESRRSGQHAGGGKQSKAEAGGGGMRQVSRRRHAAGVQDGSLPFRCQGILAKPLWHIVCVYVCVHLICVCVHMCVHVVYVTASGHMPCLSAFL